MRFTAPRIAVRSPSSGMPAAQLSTTRPTVNGTSSSRFAFGCQFASARTWRSVTRFPSQFRSSDSSTMRSDTGSRETRPMPCSSSAGSEK